MLVDRVNAIQRRYRHFHRYREIVSVLYKYGFGVLLRRLGLLKYLRWGHWRRETIGTEYVPSNSERVRLALEELGPTFVKLGQVLSTRRDLIPPQLILELEKLQDAVPPFPDEAARRIIEEELHQPIGKLFRTLNAAPLASASIAQVHEGYTLNGEHVVIKVRRPGIEKKVEADLEVMADLAHFIERLVREAAIFQPVRLVEEFARSLRRELNFSTEAAHLERFTRNFAGDPRIVVPKVYRALSSERVLTMEYIGGLKISLLEEYDAQGLDRNQVAAHGAQLVMEQIFIHGFFHADPHPGNLRVLPGNRICFLDYGMMGMISARQRELLSDLIIGLASRDEQRITEAVIRLSGYSHLDRVAEIEKDVLLFIDTYLYLPLRDLQIGPILNELFRLLIRFEMRMPAEFFLLNKSISTMEGVGRVLAPDFDIMQHAEPFARRLLKERFSVKRFFRQFSTTSIEFQRLARELPHEIREILSQLKSGELKVRFEHRGLGGLTHALDQVSNRISFAIVLAALLIGSALMVHSGIPPRWHDLPLIGVGGFCISGLMGFSLLYSILKHGRM